MKVLRSEAEKEVSKRIEEIFLRCPDTVEAKLENFPKYVRRQHLTRFLAMYEVFKLVLPVKGSIIECGVFRGFGVMSWAKLSAILEPVNLSRRIYGFDTFEGFPAVSQNDQSQFAQVSVGDLKADSYDELLEIIQQFDRDRFVGHIPKIELIKGDVLETIPEFLKIHEYLVVSLLHLDFDCFEPTKAAIEAFVPRMPKGAVLAFDELDDPRWPGETRALLETLGVKDLRLRRMGWDPYLSYAIL